MKKMIKLGEFWFSDEKAKNWWFFAIYRYLAIFSQKPFKKGFAPFCSFVIVLV